MRLRSSLLFGIGSAALALACSAAPTGEDGATAASASTTDDEAIAKLRESVKDVELEHVTLPALAELPAPKKSASSGASVSGGSLYGVDWFQKWPEGVSANHDWDKGSEMGKRCMWAAVLRFEAIFASPPDEYVAFLREYSRWRGSFYNWVDDYSRDDSYGEAERASLWAWRTGLSKWISAAAKDGSCFLPTRKMLVDYVKACREHQASNDGEMQGCAVNR